MLSQKEAAYQAIVNVTGFSGEGKCEPSREQRAQINMILCEGFKSGHIALDRTFDDSELKAYVSGLVSNWLRKDNRLNGGVKYTPKNPGSRSGSGDAQLKALRALLSTTEDEQERTEIQGFIDKRVAELKPKVTVDFSALPEELRHLIK